MKETKQKFLNKLEENQLAQEIDNSVEEIDNNNNPVNKTNMTIDPKPTIGDDNVIDLPIEERPRRSTTNTVRYIDSGFTF